VDKMKNFTTLVLCVLLLFTTFMLSSCGQSSIRINNPRMAGIDPNSPVPIEATGKAAETLAQQIADNIETEAARLTDLFEYNSLLFLTLFLVMLGGVVFAILTKSSWGWIIPTVAGAGLAALIFIVQAAVYIKWIGLGIVLVAFGVLIYKAWEYQKERNALTNKEVVK
jgi:hypothetical protein